MPSKKTQTKPAAPPANDAATEKRVESDYIPTGNSDKAVAERTTSAASVPAALMRLEQARALPLAADDAEFGDVAFEPGSIDRFMDQGDRVMCVVAVDGVLCKAPAEAVDGE